MEDKPDSVSDNTSTRLSPSANDTHPSGHVERVSPLGDYTINAPPDDTRMEVREPDFVLMLPDGSEHVLLMGSIVTTTGQPVMLK